jgi:hypothetical protein
MIANEYSLTKVIYQGYHHDDAGNGCDNKGDDDLFFIFFPKTLFFFHFLTIVKVTCVSIEKVTEVLFVKIKRKPKLTNPCY